MLQRNDKPEFVGEIPIQPEKKWIASRSERIAEKMIMTRREVDDRIVEASRDGRVDRHEIDTEEEATSQDDQERTHRLAAGPKAAHAAPESLWRASHRRSDPMSRWQTAAHGTGPAHYRAPAK